jgi:hypothetical protein
MTKTAAAPRITSMRQSRMNPLAGAGWCVARTADETPPVGAAVTDRSLIPAVAAKCRP